MCTYDGMQFDKSGRSDDSFSMPNTTRESVARVRVGGSSLFLLPLSVNSQISNAPKADERQIQCIYQQSWNLLFLTLDPFRFKLWFSTTTAAGQARNKANGRIHELNFVLPVHEAQSCPHVTHVPRVGSISRSQLTRRSPLFVPIWPIELLRCGKGITSVA